jgi:hypothetical protein
MNSSANASLVYEYYTVKSLLTNFVGSLYLTDVLNFYPFTIISILSLFLNIFALVIFMDKEEFSIPFESTGCRMPS